MTRRAIVQKWILYCLCALVLLAVQLRMPTILVPKLPHRHTSLLFFLVSVGACLFVMGISGIYTGFRLKLNLSDVYGIRAEAAAYDIPGLFAYVLSWMNVSTSLLNKDVACENLLSVCTLYTKTL